MSNTLTSVAPVLYSAARVVPREITGFLAACQMNFDDRGVAKGDTVKIGVVPSMSTSDVTPSQTFSAGSDRSFTSASLTLNNFKEVTWNLTAEQERSLQNSGIAQDLLKQTVEQAFRSIVNGIEANVATTADLFASRAYGTAATTPFATSISDLANPRKILIDNGAAPVDIHCVMSTAAGVNFRTLTNIYKVNEAGDNATLRRGDLGEIYGIELHESAQVVSHTAGTGASYVVNNASGYAIGTTTFAVDIGSGTILPGDVITLGSTGGSSYKYVVVSSVGGGTVTSVTIQEPGLRVAAADEDTVTLAATHSSNIVMQRSGIVAVVRPALQPDGAIAEQMVLTDDKTGLSALLLRVPGNAMSTWSLRCVYDSFAPNSFAIAKLLG